MNTDPDLSALLAEHRDQIQAFVESLVSQPKRRCVGVEDAGQYVGLSGKSIRRLIAKGELSKVEIVKGKVLVAIDDLDRLVDSKRERVRRLRLAR